MAEDRPIEKREIEGLGERQENLRDDRRPIVVEMSQDDSLDAFECPTPQELFQRSKYFVGRFIDIFQGKDFSLKKPVRHNAHEACKGYQIHDQQRAANGRLPDKRAKR